MLFDFRGYALFAPLTADHNHVFERLHVILFGMLISPQKVPPRVHA